MDAAGTDYGPLPWVADRAVSVLACTEQYQFCNSSTYCSSLDGIFVNDNLDNPYFGLIFNDEQKAIFKLVLDAARFVTLNMAIFILGDDFVLARDSVLSSRGQESAPLPDTQWHDEVNNMAASMLAALQRRVVDFVSPPDIPIRTVLNGSVSSLVFIDNAALEAGERSLCQNVRIRDAQHYNFSVVGLMFIMVLGTTIILVNIACIPALPFWARRKLRLGEFARREWLQGHLFALQRTAFEKHGVGPWEMGDGGDVPVTAEKRSTFSGESIWKVRRTTWKNSRERPAKCSSGNADGDGA